MHNQHNRFTIETTVRKHLERIERFIRSFTYSHLGLIIEKPIKENKRLIVFYLKTL